MKLLYLVSYMEIIYDIFQNTHLYIMFFESDHLVRHSVLMHPQHFSKILAYYGLIYTFNMFQACSKMAAQNILTIILYTKY